MFSPELENLIQATLEDGMLEDYEKAALVKRAQAEGADLAELEIYINSILQKRKREADKEKNAKLEQMAQKKKEALRTCPGCGASIPVMAISCPKCGYELSDQKALSSVQTLADKIEKISASLRKVNDDSGKSVVHEIFKPMSIENKKDAIYEDIINAINMFPVPNTKQDIIEFLTLSCTKAKYKGGLWGTKSGHFKLLLIIAIALAIICGVIVLIAGGELWVFWTALASVELSLLVYGGGFFANTGKDIIRYNKVAAAWSEKFEEVMLKARSLRADAEFTQQLDYFENLFNNIKQSNNSLLAAFTSFKRK